MKITCTTGKAFVANNQSNIIINLDSNDHVESLDEVIFAQNASILLIGPNKIESLTRDTVVADNSEVSILNTKFIKAGLNIATTYNNSKLNIKYSEDLSAKSLIEVGQGTLGFFEKIDSINTTDKSIYGNGKNSKIELKDINNIKGNIETADISLKAINVFNISSDIDIQAQESGNGLYSFNLAPNSIINGNINIKNVDTVLNQLTCTGDITIDNAIVNLNNVNVTGDVDITNSKVDTFYLNVEGTISLDNSSVKSINTQGENSTFNIKDSTFENNLGIIKEFSTLDNSSILLKNTEILEEISSDNSSFFIQNCTLNDLSLESSAYIMNTDAGTISLSNTGSVCLSSSLGDVDGESGDLVFATSGDEKHVNDTFLNKTTTGYEVKASTIDLTKV